MFATPLILGAIEKPAALNQALGGVLSERLRMDGAGTQAPGEGWQSTKDMLDWGGEAAAMLARDVIALADRHSIDVRQSGPRRFEWKPRMGAAIVAHGARQMPLWRPEAFWSAIYYVEDGYAGSPDRGLGGEFEIEDPRMPLVLMEGPDLRLRARPGSPIDEPSLKLRPATGRLLMFPGWLRRGSRPYVGNGQQISIAIDLIAAPLD